jgi:hypothetical protein
MMIEHDYYYISELVDRWREFGLTEERLLRYGKEGKLQFSYILKPFGEIDCIHFVTYESEDDKDVVKTAYQISTGCEELVKVSSKFISTLIEVIQSDNSLYECDFFDLPLIMQETSEKEQICLITEPSFDKDSRIKVYLKAKDFVVKVEEVQRFEIDFKEQPLPPYLNPDKEFYSKHIDVLIRVWTDIFENHLYLDQKTCKQAAKRCIEEKYEEEFQITATDNIEYMSRFINACISERWSEFTKKHGKNEAPE